MVTDKEAFFVDISNKKKPKKGDEVGRSEIVSHCRSPGHRYCCSTGSGEDYFNLPMFSRFLQIPPVHSAPLAFLSFSAKGTTVSLEERQSVLIWNAESIVFVQTDKPIYKPGQTGECLLCLQRGP